MLVDSFRCPGKLMDASGKLRIAVTNVACLWIVTGWSEIYENASIFWWVDLDGCFWIDFKKTDGWICVSAESRWVVVHI